MLGSLGTRGTRLVTTTAVSMLLALIAAAPASAAIQFSPIAGSPFATSGTSPAAMARGAFNPATDPWTDIAVANRGNNTVSILLGGGTPLSLAGPPTSVGANQPTAIATADFNGDGVDDVVTANQTSNNVSVLLGNGSGGLAAAVGSPVATGGTSPVWIATGLFNGDANPDVAVLNQASSTMSILLGDGSGGLGPAVGSPITIPGSAPRSFVTADFDVDGDPDIVVPVTNGGANLVTLTNNGNASMTVATVSATPVTGVSTVGDFNKDGNPEFAIANGTTVYPFLGDGAGGFVAQPTLNVFSTVQGLTTGDASGDGRPDIVAAFTSSYRGLVGNGFGGFTVPSSSFVTGGSNSQTPLLEDVTHDGKLDLLIANQNSNTVSALGSAGTPTVTLVPTSVA